MSTNNSEQDSLGLLTTWSITILIFLTLSGLPILFIVLILSKYVWGEITISLILSALAGGCFGAQKFWEKNVRQNAELTNTLIRNPDGSMVAITRPGPIHLRPGAVVDGNEFERTVQTTTINLKVNRGKISLIIKGAIRWYFTDGEGMSAEVFRAALERQNRLGEKWKESTEEALRGFLEKSADIVSQNPTFIDLDNLLNHRGAFLESVESTFRHIHVPQIKSSLGIEVLDHASRGINLAIDVPKEVEAELLKLYQQEQQGKLVRDEATKIITAARASGDTTLTYEKAHETASAIISGNIQKLIGGGRGTATLIQPQQGDNSNGN